MAANNSQTILELISCPITQSIMTDPVQGPDGITYERSAIVRWLNEKSTSPMDPSRSMQSSDMTVNYSIKYMIEQYNNGVFDSSPPASDTVAPRSMLNTLSNMFSRPQNVINIADKYTITDQVTEKLDNNYLLTINSEIKPDTGEDPKRVPHDLVIVLDRSGSMGTPVTAKDEDGKNLENGFSQEDIVTHAARTVTKTLNSYDRLSVIAFDHSADLILESVQMTETNKNNSMEEIKKIKPRGSTDIWKALLMAINLLNERDDKTRNTAIILLTDGAPNSSPSLGEVETLKRMRLRTNFSTPIYTCGFGYSLARGLLYDLAKKAGGVTCHIPDGTMVATVFCNLIANILSTVAVNMQLNITARNGATFSDNTPVMGDFEYTLLQTTDLEQNSKKYCIDLGTVQMQQSRDIILKLQANMGAVDYYLTYKIGDKYYATQVKSITSTHTFESGIPIRSNMIRFYAVEELRIAIFMMSRAGNFPTSIGMEHIEKIKVKMQDMTYGPAEEGLLVSLEDQISFALSDKIDEAAYFKKWGEFYLDQFTRCLNQQFCPNFRDKALSVFGGENFTELMEETSDAFDRLETPEPSLLKITNTTRGTSSNVPHTSRTQTMTQYNSRSHATPCFHENCTIRMANSTFKCVKDLQKDDQVWTPKGPAKLICVLQTNIRLGMLDMVNFESTFSNLGLSITPNHPINFKSESAHSLTGTQTNWVFPHTIQNPEATKCNAVYSLALDKHHIVEICGVECIGLAHECSEGILEHDYFGTDKVIQDMCKMAGWDQGYIVINDGDMMRDPVTSFITGFSKITI